MEKPNATESNHASLDIPAIRAMAEAATVSDFLACDEGGFLTRFGASPWLKRAAEISERYRTAVPLLCDRIDEQAREIERLKSWEHGKKTTVHVVYIEGMDPFICGVRGWATVEALAEANELLEAHDAMPGEYEGELVYESGQFDDHGRCEIAPAWFVDDLRSLETTIAVLGDTDAD